MALSFKFGEVDAILAELSHVPSANRSAFSARLKNLHRLGFPKGIGSGRGRAANYVVSDLVQMAVAIELSQFGLLPERVVNWIEEDIYPVLMAIMMGSREALNVPDGGFQAITERSADSPFPMFLYFDPASIAPWADDSSEVWGAGSFFYGGEGLIRDNLGVWTSGFTPRMSFINVTALMYRLSQCTADPKAFLMEAVEWADAETRRDDFDLDYWVADVAKTQIERELVRDLRDTERSRRMTLNAAVSHFQFGRHIKRGIIAYGGPGLVINLPGQRQLALDTGLPQRLNDPLGELNERVAFLKTRPFATQFSDNTKYTLLYVQHDDLEKALEGEPTLWDDAFEAGVVIVTPLAFRNLMGGVIHLWNEASDDDKLVLKGADHGDR